MKRDEILNAIKSLAKMQGFYGRLLRDIEELDDDEYEELMEYLEGKNFGNTLDMILFFEC